MTDTSITLRLPPFVAVPAQPQPAPVPAPRLTAIVDRNRDQPWLGALFAIGAGALAVLTAVGIAG